MDINFDSAEPIFTQLAARLEDEILSGALPEESRIPSITELAALLRINPATALKGVNILVDSGAVYKRRGVGMFVAEGARELIRARRREGFYEGRVRPLIVEARRLEIDEDALGAMIKRGYCE